METKHKDESQGKSFLTSLLFLCVKRRSRISSAAQTLKLFSAVAPSCVQTFLTQRRKVACPKAMCGDCAGSSVKKDPVSQTFMESQTELQTGQRCQRGCGLPLSALSIRDGEHCCVEALRALTDTLEERAAASEHQARMARLRWNRREQSLVAQVATLQNEAQLAALKYQRRLHQYLLHISGITEQIGGFCKVRLYFCGHVRGSIAAMIKNNNFSVSVKKEWLTEQNLLSAQLSYEVGFRLEFNRYVNIIKPRDPMT